MTTIRTSMATLPVMLPELRSSARNDKAKPLPTTLQSDYIPEEILFALTQPSPSREKLTPLSRRRNSNTTSSFSRPPPSNVWNYKRRDHFKHLLDHVPCNCGAGKDISFLYDVPHHVPHPPKPDLLDSSSVRKKDESNLSKILSLPDSVVPEEYHVVKHKGVLGLQYHEDKYSTQPLDHQKHLVLFPSMHPSSRYEVIQLRDTFEQMMRKAGINDLEIDGPTQMHNLLELIKKEQNIYNIVFSELIRQTTVECAERGELLHLVWNKYHQLLNKVPEQIMSLHEEVIAQRILDLRLTDELIKFKGTISALTSELTDVKEHDTKVTREAQKAQEDLKNALSESQKNASLLAEYHDLYELQRQRLQRQAFMLAEERDLWSTAAYSLVLKVTEEYKLNTAKRLQLLEKSWTKLASHFTILLSDRDTDLIAKIQKHVEKWRNLVEDMNLSLKHREENLRDSIRDTRNSIEGYLTKFQQLYNDNHNGTVKIPDKEFSRSLINIMKSWIQTVVNELDTFGGVILLDSQEAISCMHSEVDGWTDSVLKMFGRHCGPNNKIHPHQTRMLSLNKEVDQLLTQLHERNTGEYGVASLLTSFQSSLETWETRLMSDALGSISLQESDWESFGHVLEEWPPLLNKAIECITLTLNTSSIEGLQLSSNSSSNIHDVIQKTQKWATEASISIDSEDAKLVKQVSTFHSEIVKWMIQILLRLAPGKEGNSLEASEVALLGSASIPQLIESANTLFESLETFSNYVALSCDGIVVENTQKRQDNNEENAGYELNDLKRLKTDTPDFTFMKIAFNCLTECRDWIHTAMMLMSQLTGQPMEEIFQLRTSSVPQDKADHSHQVNVTSEERETFQTAENDGVEVPELACDVPKEANREQELGETNVPKAQLRTSTSETESVNTLHDKHTETTETHFTNEENSRELTKVDAELDNMPIPLKGKVEEGDNIEVLGFDANTHRQNIEGKYIKILDHHSTKLDTDKHFNTRKAFEALAAVEALQNQLIMTEERAQLAEERALKAEAEIVALEKRIRALEKQAGKQLEQMDDQTSSASATDGLTLPTAIGSHKSPKTNPGIDLKEEKSGRKSGKSSSRSSKKH